MFYTSINFFISYLTDEKISVFATEDLTVYPNEQSLGRGDRQIPRLPQCAYQLSSYGQKHLVPGKKLSYERNLPLRSPGIHLSFSGLPVRSLHRVTQTSLLPYSH